MVIRTYSSENPSLFFINLTQIKLILVNMLKQFLEAQPNGIHFEWRGVRQINCKVIFFAIVSSDVSCF